MLGDAARSYPVVEPFFIGGVGDEVTASSAILRIRTSDGKVSHVMIDAGAAQGAEEFRNLEYPIHGDMIDAIVLTHAHYDHIGDLALLYKSGFRGKIYTTDVAKKISYPMLVDAAKIQENRPRSAIMSHNKHYEGKRLHDARSYCEEEHLNSASSNHEHADYEPLYTQADVEAVKEQIKTVRLASYVEVVPGVRIRMLPTTHQNGACRIEVHVQDPNGQTYGIAFTGDLGPSESLLYKQKYDYTSCKINCLVLESLHGTSEPVETLKTSIKRLYEIIRKAKRQRKHVVLMGFSLDRNAMLIYLLNRLCREMGVYIDVVVDSPLTMTELAIYQATYENESKWFKNLGADPFGTDNFRVIRNYHDHLESVLHGEAPRVIITASATGNGGRVVDYFENCLQRDDYIFVVCGWVSPDSPSGLILEARYGEKVFVNDRTYVKRCKTYHLHGFTSHGYYPEMVTAVTDYPHLDTIVLNHARTDDKIQVERALKSFFEGEIFIPKIYDAYELSKEPTVILERERILSDFKDVIDQRVVMAEYDDAREDFDFSLDTMTCE